MPRTADTSEKQLSPIAHFLQERVPKPWTRPMLAKALGVPRTTVDGWFLHPTTSPKSPALYAIARVTKTPIEQVAKIAGYKEVPPEPDAGVWAYLLEEIATDAELTSTERGKLKMLLSRWRGKYEQPGVRAPVGRVARGRMAALPAPVPSEHNGNGVHKATIHPIEDGVKTGK